MKIVFIKCIRKIQLLLNAKQTENTIYEKEEKKNPMLMVGLKNLSTNHNRNDQLNVKKI